VPWIDRVRACWDEGLAAEQMLHDVEIQPLVVARFSERLDSLVVHRANGLQQSLEHLQAVCQVFCFIGLLRGPHCLHIETIDSAIGIATFFEHADLIEGPAKVDRTKGLILSYLSPFWSFR